MTQNFQTSAEDILFREILMTKYIHRIGNFLEYALYKFTLYLLTFYNHYVISLTGISLIDGYLYFAIYTR